MRANGWPVALVVSDSRAPSQIVTHWQQQGSLLLFDVSLLAVSKMSHGSNHFSSEQNRVVVSL